jgi:hypothetical protein
MTGSRTSHLVSAVRGRTLAREADAGRWALRAMSAAVCLLLVALFAPIAIRVTEGIRFGVDLDIYLDATRRWLGGGTFYLSWQLAEHYPIWGETVAPILYPPVALLLFVPFTILPTFLWWAIPAALFGWAMWRLAPHPMSWPVMTVLAIFSPCIRLVWSGNPVMWVTAFLAVGCVRAGPAVLVFLKPSLFPFALMGANRRRWWIALGVLALASLPFGFMWLDWGHALLNSDGSIGYSVLEALVVAIPLVAWVARHR